jgi:hypothetical protein
MRPDRRLPTKKSVVIRDPMIGPQPPDRALDQSIPGRGCLPGDNAGLTNRDGFSDMLALAE